MESNKNNELNIEEIKAAYESEDGVVVIATSDSENVPIHIFVHGKNGEVAYIAYSILESVLKDYSKGTDVDSLIQRETVVKRFRDLLEVYSNPELLKTVENNKKD